MASRLVNECRNVTILDLTDQFLGPDRQIKKELYADGLHLSVNGYKIWAENLLPTLHKLSK